MRSTPRSLRLVSALCLALVVYAAVPHLHAAGESPARPSTLPSVRASESPRASDSGVIDADAIGFADRSRAFHLSSDDSHEDHSSGAALDAHPCALCRGKAGREIAAPQPGAPWLDVAVLGRHEPAAEATLAEHLFAGHRPARAPPLA